MLMRDDLDYIMIKVGFKDYEIHVETYGKGQPLIILNGIMMSTKSWIPFIEDFSKDNQLILIDFLDQGQSSKLVHLDYDQSIQVEALHHVIKHLKLEKINLLGISYGGEVAIQYALKHSEYVEKLLLFNTTAWTSPWLKEIGHAWKMASFSGESYYATTIPVIYSPSFYTSNIEWIENRKKTLIPIFSDKDFIDSMNRLTDSAEDYDKRKELRRLKTKTLVVSSDTDFVTPVLEQKLIVDSLENVDHIIIPNCGHASMYEAPVLFKSLVLGFIKDQTEFKLQ